MRAAPILLATALTACAGSSAVPRWEANAAGELEAYRTAALSGSEAAAKSAYRYAVAALKQGGDLEGLATASLTRCAIEAAVGAKRAGCAEYAAIRQVGGSPAREAYTHWLEGKLGTQELLLLPETSRALAAAWLANDGTGIAVELERIEPPLSWLVAFSVVKNRLPDAAPAWRHCQSLTARQGWSAAYRACLQHEAASWESHGDTVRAAWLRKKIEVLAP